MINLLADKVAYVTGGSNGLGREIINVFAENGAVGTAADLVSSHHLSPLPHAFEYLETDVTNETSLKASISETIKQHGRLDIVVANAGIVPPWSKIEDLDFALWPQILAVNIQGIAATLKHSVPELKKNGGSIIVTASISSYRSPPFQMLYTSTKHAALGIVRTSAQELGRYGVRVNAIAPGPVATEAFMQRIRARADCGATSEEKALKSLADETALGRMVTPTEVANATLFYASDLSSGVTGTLLSIDAGIL